MQSSIEGILRAELHKIQRKCTHFSSCNPHGVRKCLIKGEALRLLRTNSSAKSFYENIYNFKKNAFTLEATLTIS